MDADEMPSFVVSEPLDPQYRDEALGVFTDALAVLAADPALITVSAGYLYDRKGCAATGGFGSAPNKTYARPETDDIFMQVTVVVPKCASKAFAARARELDARIRSDKFDARRKALEAELLETEALVAVIKARLGQMGTE